MSDLSRERAERPSMYTKWLSPEGYLGLHLLVGFLVALLGGIIFANIADEVLEPSTVVRIDNAVVELARTVQSPWLTPIMIAASVIGGGGTIAILSIVVGIWLGVAHAKRRLVMFVAVMSLGPLLNYALKLYFQRARPEGWSELFASGYSFPSGHSMGSMLFFGALAYVIYFSIERHWVIRLLLVIGCFAMALLIGASRIYLGVHFLSDVIAGFAGGLAWIGICVSATEAWLRWRSWRHHRRDRLAARAG